MQPLVLSRRRILLGALVVAAVLLAAAHFLLRSGAAAVAVPAPLAGTDDGSAASPGAPAAGRLVVYVVGAVRRPGLYRLPAGSRVDDAVLRAGGVTRNADRTAVNLAAPVADGEQVLVPALLPRAVAAAQGAAEPSSAAVSATPAAPIQLSVATPEQLDSLPGIGPVTAQKIVAYRAAHGPFQSVDDLENVPGIGPAHVDQLRGLVVP